MKAMVIFVCSICKSDYTFFRFWYFSDDFEMFYICRKYAEKVELPAYHPYQYLELEPGINAGEDSPYLVITAIFLHLRFLSFFISFCPPCHHHHRSLSLSLEGGVSSSGVWINFPPLSVPRLCDGYATLKKQLIEEHEYAIELERRRLLELQLTPKRQMPQPETGNRIDELNIPEGENKKDYSIISQK